MKIFNSFYLWAKENKENFIVSVFEQERKSSDKLQLNILIMQKESLKLFDKKYVAENFPGNFSHKTYLFM